MQNKENSALNSALPTSWQIKTLAEVCEITMGQSPLGENVIDKDKNTNSKAMEFHQGKIHFTDKFISTSEVVTTDIRKVAQKNSILLCVRAPVGVINITQRQIAIGRGLCALNFKNKNSNNDFLYFYLLTLKDYFNAKATGSTFSAINLDIIKNTKIPLPPLEIQQEIVKRLDECFAKIDKGTLHLKSAKENVAKFKQSLLKAAFEGTLTHEHTTPVIEGECNERGNLSKKSMDCHESANADSRNDGLSCHDLTSSNLAMTNKENSALNSALPTSWQIKTLAEVLSSDKYAMKRGPFGSSLKKSFFVKSGVRVFEQYNPINQDTNWKRYFITKEKFKELEAFKAGAGDLLISCSGTLGKILELPQDVEVGIINQALLKIRLDNTKILNSYFVHLFNSPNMQRIILENTIGTAIQNIASVKTLKQIKIPLPPLEIQQEIVRILDKNFKCADKTQEFIDSALNKAKQLKQSLLKAAFSGELV